MCVGAVGVVKIVRCGRQRAVLCGARIVKCLATHTVVCGVLREHLEDPHCGVWCTVGTPRVPTLWCVVYKLLLDT